MKKRVPDGGGLFRGKACHYFPFIPLSLEMEESLLPNTKNQTSSSEGSSATKQASSVDYRLWVSVAVSVVAVIFAIVCLSRTVSLSSGHDG